MKTKSKRNLSYLFILAGAILIFGFHKESTGHPYYLIAGILLLMPGLYLVGSSLGPRPKNQDSYIITEEEDEGND